MALVNFFRFGSRNLEKFSEAGEDGEAIKPSGFSSKTGSNVERKISFKGDNPQNSDLPLLPHGNSNQHKVLLKSTGPQLVKKKSVRVDATATAVIPRDISARPSLKIKTGRASESTSKIQLAVGTGKSEEIGFWRKLARKCKSKFLSSKSKIMEWTQSTQIPEDDYTDGDFSSPVFDKLYDLKWKFGYGPDFYLATAAKARRRRSRQTCNQETLPNTFSETILRPIPEPISAHSSEAESAHINPCSRQSSVVSRNSVHSSRDAASFLVDLNGLEDFYANDESGLFFNNDASPPSAQELKKTPPPVREFSYIRNRLARPKDVSSLKFERDEESANVQSCADDVEVSDDEVSFDWGSNASEIVREESIPVYYTLTESASLNFQEVVSETSLVSADPPEDNCEISRGRSLRYMNSNDDNSFNEWRRPRQTESTFRPLCLVESSRSFSWLLDSLDGFKYAEENQATVRGGEQSSCDVSDGRTESSFSKSSSRFPLGFLKELRLVRKRFGTIKEATTTVSQYGSREFPRNIDVNRRNGVSPIDPNRCGTLTGRTPSSRPSRNLSLEIKKNPKEKSLGISQNASLSVHAEITELKTRPVNDSESSSLSSKIRAESKFTKIVSRIFANAWTKDRIPHDTLWKTLALDNDADFQAVRLDYLKGDEPQFLQEAKKLLQETLEFSDLTLELANHVSWHGANSCGEKRDLSSDENLAIIKRQKKSLYLDSVGNKSNTQSLGELTAYTVVTPLYQKYFEQPLSDKKRKSLDKKLWDKVIRCQSKVVELRLQPSLSGHQKVLDAFSECFKLSGEDYARVAKAQILEYICRLVEIRKEIFSVFDGLTGIGNEYANILYFLSKEAESTDSLIEAENRSTKLLILLANSSLLLDGVQNAILKMKRGFSEYVIPMVNFAQSAIMSRIESTDTYKDFCLINAGQPLDVTKLHEETQFEKFISESEFLMDRMELFQASTFEDALKELHSCYEIVGNLRVDLELHIKHITGGISRIRPGPERGITEQSPIFSPQAATIFEEFEGGFAASAATAESLDAALLQSLGTTSSNDEQIAFNAILNTAESWPEC